jgi:nitroreductase
MNARPDINPVLELLKTRRSAPVLAMQGPGPDAVQVRDLLTVASRVPDHGKLAPWRFVLFEGPARERAGEIISAEFVRLNPSAEAQQVEIERKRFMHAPLVIGVVSRAAPHPKIPEWEQVLSAGAVCMNLEIAAHSMGFVACWLTQWYSYKDSVKAAFGLAPDEKIAGFVHIGRKEGAVEDRPRPSLDSIVTRF